MEPLTPEELRTVQEQCEQNRWQAARLREHEAAVMSLHRELAQPFKSHRPEALPRVEEVVLQELQQLTYEQLAASTTTLASVLEMMASDNAELDAFNQEMEGLNAEAQSLTLENAALRRRIQELEAELAQAHRALSDRSDLAA